MPLSKINSNSFSTTANTNIDSGTLFIDAINNRVGAGTTAPISQFHAKGAGSGTFAPYNDPLVVEGSDYTYLHLKSTNNQAAVLYNRGGSTGWFHGLDNSGNLKTVYMSAINGTALGNAKDGTAAMLIDSSSRITKPLQPAFRAGLNSSQTVAVSDYAKFQNASGSASHFNIGNHYNTNTGIFTAPIAGRYFITTCIIYQDVTNGLDMGDLFYITVNGGNSCYAFKRGHYSSGTTGNGGYYTDHANVILNISASDQIGIQVSRAGTLHANQVYCWFAGYLLG